MNDETLTRANPDVLHGFCARAFQAVGVPAADAALTADVILAASLRGVDSHGIIWLPRYIERIQWGMIRPDAHTRLVHESPTTALMDAGGGLGQPAGYRAMQEAIRKARQYGTGWVTVRNSNHYGIAGYYAMLALKHDMIGLSMTNADPSVLPTFGLARMLGTNPIAVAAPAGRERPFVLDMATSVVAVGKINLARRAGRPIPSGWATDESGAPSTDPDQVMEGRTQKRPGGVLPLGGIGEQLGGHKGYGLGLLVEILTGILSGSATADQTYPTRPDGTPLPADLGHFFGAIRLDGFGPVQDFKAAMDDLIGRLRNTPRIAGAERIYIAGEKEFEETERRATAGIPLSGALASELRALAEELGVTVDL
jgi:L-2-hydroxycarboxylate dehydrogenase (NAD+)